TDRPVAVFFHAPAAVSASNEGALLLPEHVMTGNYIVASYPNSLEDYPSYFTAIGATDQTTVQFTVPQPTLAGGGIPALQAIETGQTTLDRYELLNVVPAADLNGDLSGTIVTANHPIWLTGAVECVNVPNSGFTFCDPLYEVMFPLETWGQEYVAATAPPRSNESFHWRIYAGADNVTISANPPQQGLPANLAKGEFVQVVATEHFVLTGDGPFLPVQYLEGKDPFAGVGDPAMIQAVPTEQWLTRYA